MIAVAEKRDARSLDRGTLEEMRRLAVKRVLAGEACVDVARSLEVHPNTISKWMTAHREGGDAALRRRKAPGRTPKLDGKQVAKLRTIIVGKNPRQLGFGAALWSLPIVGQVIERTFGVVLHKGTIGRLLHRMGLTPQKPRRRAFSRDEAECARWATVDFPGIVRRAKKRQATLLFQDETGVQEDGPLDRTWGERGRRPVVEVTGSRRRVNVISAISPRGRLWFRCFHGNLNAGRFVDFLRDLLRDVRGPIELVLDKHPAHVAAATRRFVHEHADRLTIHYLPGYAPELNPDEHVWSYLKGLFRRDPVEPGEDLTSAVHETMVQIRDDRALVRRFFDSPEVAYVRNALHW